MSRTKKIILLLVIWAVAALGAVRAVRVISARKIEGRFKREIAPEEKKD